MRSLALLPARDFHRPSCRFLHCSRPAPLLRSRMRTRGTFGVRVACSLVLCLRVRDLRFVSAALSNSVQYHAIMLDISITPFVGGLRRHRGSAENGASLANRWNIEIPGASQAPAFTSGIWIENQIRSGRSLVGKGRLPRGRGLKTSGEPEGPDGNPPVSAKVVATTGVEVVSKSSAAIFCGARDIQLQTPTQDEQSRSPEDPVLSGPLSGDSLGHLFGHPSGQRGDSFSV